MSRLQHCAGGHGLTVAAQEDPPTTGQTRKQGEWVAKLAPMRRTAGGSKWLRRAFSEGLRKGWVRPPKGMEDRIQRLLPERDVCA